MQRSCVGDVVRHAGSEAEPLQVGAIPSEVVGAVATGDAVLDKERAELAPRGRSVTALSFGFNSKHTISPPDRS